MNMRYRGADGIDASANGSGTVRVTNAAGATITTRGTGARGIQGNNGNGGNTAVTNHGSIVTHGGVAFDPTLVGGQSPRAADGLTATVSGTGGATGTNEDNATIETHGMGTRGFGVIAENDGKVALGTNRGTITTRGDEFNMNTTATDSSGNTVNYHRRSDGVYVFAEARNQAVARVTGTNEATGRITTYGTGARGLVVGTGGTGRVSVVAGNRGTITTSGGISTANYAADGLVAFAPNRLSNATNETEGTITVSGAGARGISAMLESSSGVANGVAQASNRGTVISSGNAHYPTSTSVPSRGSEGVYAFAESGGAEALNSGRVKTKGLGARGVYAYVAAATPAGEGVQASIAEVSNSGTIETRGNQAAGASITDTRAAHGLAAGINANGVRAMASNSKRGDNIGTITTRGARAFGVFAFATRPDQTGTEIIAINHGNVTTTEENEGTPSAISAGGAHGVLAFSPTGGTQSAPNTVSVTNGEPLDQVGGAIVSTWSDQSTGVAALIQVSSTSTTPVTAYGTAMAGNAGTISTQGGLGSSNTDVLFGANGLAAGYFVAPEDSTTRVMNAGNVTVNNTGMVTTQGAGVAAVVARSYGAGTVTVNLLGRRVLGTSGPIPVFSTSTVTSNGANSYGLYAQTGSGAITVNLSNTNLTAPTAVQLVGGRANTVNVGMERSDTIRIAGAIAVDGGTTTVNVGENTNATFTGTVGSSTQRLSAFNIASGATVELHGAVHTGTVSLARGSTFQVIGFGNGQTALNASGALTMSGTGSGKVTIDPYALDLVVGGTVNVITVGTNSIDGADFSLTPNPNTTFFTTPTLSVSGGTTVLLTVGAPPPVNLGSTAQTLGGNTVRRIIQAVNGAAAGQGELRITNTAGVTFAEAIGASRQLGTLSVGTSTAKGVAVFDNTVNVGTIEIAGGDAAGEDSTATFRGTQVTGTVRLDDNGGRTAKAVFAGTAAQTLTGTVDGAAAGEGTLEVTNALGVSFTGTIGANRRLNRLQIGTSTEHGVAVFDETVSAGTFEMVAGDATGENSMVTFKGAQVTIGTVRLDESDDRTAKVVFAGTAAQTLTGTVDGAAAGEGTLEVNNAMGVSFTGAIGASQQLRSLIVGTSTAKGVAVFDNTVSAGTIEITGGDAEGEDSTATFRGTRVIGTVMLDDTGDRTTKAVFVGTAAQTLIGAVEGGAAGEGALEVTNAMGATFTGTVGATYRLNRLAVGTSTSKGVAVFDGTVNVGTIEIAGGDAEGEDSTATFRGAQVTGAVRLDDNGGRTAKAVFAGTAAQTLTGAVEGGAAGEGALEVTNALGATFTGAIGATNRLRALTVGTSTSKGVAEFNSTVNVGTMQIAGGDGAGENSTATFRGMVNANTLRLDDNGGRTAKAVFAGTAAQTLSGTFDGAAAGEGTLEVTNALGATFTGTVGATHRLNRLAVGTSTSKGVAVFDNTVNVGTIEIAGGDAAGENSTATFRGMVNANTLRLDDNGDRTAKAAFAGTVLQTLSEGVDGGAAGEGILEVTNAATGAVFMGDIGARQRLGTLSVGTSTAGGVAAFNGTVNVGTIEITGGDAAGEDSAAFFSGAEITGAVRLDDNGEQTAEVVFTRTEGQRFTGAVDGAAAGEGTLEVSNGALGASFAGFSGAIGARQQLRRLIIGRSEAEAGSATRAGRAARGGVAVFNNTVNVGTIEIAGGTGGQEGSNSTATFRGAQVTGAVRLDDNEGRTAKAVFSGTVLQTINGAVDGGAAGEGTLEVNNALGVSFTGAIGATQQLGTLTVGTSTAGGVASFSGTVNVGTIQITGGDAAGENSTAFFRGTQVTGAVRLDDNGEQTAKVVFTRTEGQRFTGTVDGAAAGEGTLEVSNGALRASLAGFSGAIGARQQLGRLIIGTSAARGGVAVFDNTVNVGTIEITGGTGREEGSNSTATFRGTQVTGAVRLDDNEGRTAKAVFAGTAEQGINGAVDGAAAGEGTLEVTNAMGATFAGTIGATQQLRSLAVGTSTSKGVAIFDNTVNVGTIEITGGDAEGEDSTATFRGTQVTGAVRLDDNGARAAKAVFAGTAAQTLTGAVDGAAAGEGTLEVTNAQRATFAGAIGARQQLGTLTVGTSTAKGVAVFDNTVNVGTIQIAGGDAEGENSTATFRGAQVTGAVMLDDTGGRTAKAVFAGTAAQTLSGAVDGAAAGEGTLEVTNAMGATFTGAIGASQQLGTLTVGTSTSKGVAVFDNTVNAGTIQIAGGGSAGEASMATFGRIVGSAGQRVNTLSVASNATVELRGAVHTETVSLARGSTLQLVGFGTDQTVLSTSGALTVSGEGSGTVMINALGVGLTEGQTLNVLEVGSGSIALDDFGSGRRE